MRNIIEFPATLPEIAATLREVSQQLLDRDIADQACGNMQPYLLSKAAEVIAELHDMIAHAPTALPNLPENPSAWQVEDHGHALVEYAFAEMVRKVLTRAPRVDVEMPTDR
jgi:hypothetical protein